MAGMDTVPHFPCLPYLACFHIPVTRAGNFWLERQVIWEESWLVNGQAGDLALDMTPTGAVEKHGKESKWPYIYWVLNIRTQWI